MAVVAAIVGAVASAALAYAMTPDAPDAPNLAQANKAGVLAQARTLDERRKLEAAAQQGTSVQWRDPGTHEETRQFAVIMGGNNGHGLGAGTSVPYVEADWKEGGKYWDPKAPNKQPFIISKKVQVPNGMRTADFTGYGEADVQGAIARQMADIELELSKKYGKQFVEEARKQLELSDPEGAAARKKLYELIQQQIENEPERPVADLLDSQVSEQLAAGRGLDRVSEDVLREAVAQAGAARGGAGDGDYAEPLTTGFEGQRRLDAAQQKSLSWLTSGATPEDVEYRRDQQNLSNLSAFIQGRTPESQFATLSGAQQGATPMNPGNRLASQDPNAGAAMQNAQLQGWQTQMNAQMNQADPWMAGLSVLLRGAGTAGAAGWKPLAKTA